MVTVCAVTTTLFLGGWHGPFHPVINFVAKLYFLIFTCMWIRATYPRYRYDQLMGLGWKFFLPLTLINIAVTGIVVAL
jgi:NADH-quinone oxidoreductase subunit H